MGDLSAVYSGGSTSLFYAEEAEADRSVPKFEQMSLFDLENRPPFSESSESADVRSDPAAGQADTPSRSAPVRPVDRSFEEKEKSMQKAMLEIKNKYGKNAILKGMNLQEGATTIERNSQVGGHKA